MILVERWLRSAAGVLTMHPVHGYIGKQKSRVAADDVNYLGSPDEDYDGVDKPDTDVRLSESVVNGAPYPNGP